MHPHLPRRRGSASGRLLPLAALLLAAQPVAAQLEGEPYAAAQLTYDSNLLRFRDADEAQAVSGKRERADTVQALRAGVALQYTLGLQRFYGGAEHRELRYERNEQLDHSEHRVLGGLQWQVAHVADGVLEAEEDKRIESFENRNSDALSLVTQRRLRSENRLAVTPDWQLQLDLTGERQRHSLESSRNYDRDEEAARVAVARTAPSLLNGGLSLEQRRGDYPEREPREGLAESYDQRTAELFAVWASPVSSLRVEIGHTRRDNEGENVEGFGAVTGSVSWDRGSDGKHQLRLEGFREIRSVEEVDANAVTETGVSLGLDWFVTAKTVLRTVGQWRHSDFAETSASAGHGRRDQDYSAELALQYKPLFWLSLQPLLALERRRSNRQDREYEDVRVGLELELRYD